jgi:hypothetical protein
MKIGRISTIMLALLLSQCFVRAGDTHVNPSEFWNGAWQEDTNGWRVQLCVSPNNRDLRLPPPKGFNPDLIVQWGSIVRNSGGGYLRTPNGKFAKFQLRDADGNVIPPKPSAGTNLLENAHPRLIHDTNLPAWAEPSGGSLEAHFPKTITADVYPREQETHSLRIITTNGLPVAIDTMASSTNRHPRRIIDTMTGNIWAIKDLPPETINMLHFNDLYSITKEGDYTLTVQPVLYKQYNHTNPAVLDRVDLPCVTTKVHLVPNVRFR